MPTLNAARVLEESLSSFFNQDYPKEKLEIVIGDGGSTDKTLAIAKKYRARVYKNPLKTSESGKAVALKQSKGELALLMDSDNILPDKTWLKKMVEPFSDREILGSEPWEFTYDRQDGYIGRYCALIGANDPYCYFVGNYDKRSVLSGKWTGLKLEETDKGEYLKVKIEGEVLPTIGANGTIWRKDVLKAVVAGSDYLFDTDIPYALKEKSPFYFAKVKTSIIHLYCKDFNDFYRKQKRRAKDFFHLEKKEKRQQTYQRQLDKQLKFIFSTALVFPLIFQSIKGHLKKPDLVWAFHPIACLVTLWLYVTETIISLFKTEEMDRSNWKQ
jgi:glycosyltransferase involved in cell wall biosynthesis